MNSLTVYAIYWPNQRVLKVGRARTFARVRELLSTGGEPVLLMRDRPAWEETAALVAMRSAFPAAFASEWDAYSLLPRGRGFTECFGVEWPEVEVAVATILRGIATYGFDQGEAVAAGVVDGSEVDHVVVDGEVDGGGPADAGGRSGSGFGDGGVGEGRRVACGSGCVGVGYSGSSSDVGRGWLYRPVRRRVVDVLPGGRLAGGVASVEAEAACTPSGASPETFRRASRGLLGWGEGGWRGCRGESRGESRLEILWCSSVSVLQAPPSRDLRRLSSLRDGEARPPGMVTRKRRVKSGLSTSGVA